ncbi:hypothetical protein P691DRAFT_717785 [Macrolepiota fuliginosa MF-IS2]|uniref:Cryptic loci regulator 2 N-terminal domain-containing protein n=1 Tax=Macrolepiota fuliginosa MF-IS2 TaxID=1400762 RepID=A0A9P5XS15_9AGAR|nr:hypothetical protein P691DRAFT_717785 [Macrolepiota fuliginosa MF-IS2]
MSRRLGQPSVVFGPDTVFLDFPRSDGDDTKWPTNTIRVVDAEGQVNFMELVDIDASAQARKWRATVGKAIALKMEMPGDSNNYVLRDWPHNYRLYDHHKGPAHNPRHDLYLYGEFCCARSGRFRSINEFIPHAFWLFTDPTLNYANCDCKYCTKQPQKGITASMVDIIGTPSSASPVPRARRDKVREKSRLNRPYAAVQKVLKPAKTLKPSAYVQDSPTLAERNSDLRAVFSKNSMKLKRWYRDGEVVWCELKPPIPGPAGEESAIAFWPGLVQEYKLKAVAIPRDAEAGGSDSNPIPPQSDPGPSTSQSNGNAYEEGRGTVFEKKEQPPFRVEQSTVYLIELFAVNKSIYVSDSQVIPYQAYVPADALIAALQAVPPEHLDFDRDAVGGFNPCPGDEPPHFLDAAVPYAVAVQIASNLSQFFSVTDEWEFSYTLPPPSIPPSISQTQSDNSLHAVINAASRINSAVGAMASNTNDSSPHSHTYPYSNLSSTQPGMSQSDLDRLTSDILGSNSSTGYVRTQIRFQGLWWGPERIWVDDFVRLKVPRRCLAPYGAPDISPPAGPSKTAMEAYQVTGRDPSEIGAGTRGVFMRIDALFVVETTTKEGKKKKECRASGLLYELVDEDWREDQDENVKQAKADGLGLANPLSTQLSLSTQLPVASTSALPSTPAPPPTQSRPAPTQPTTQKTTPSTSVPPNPSTTPTQMPSNYPLPQPPMGYCFRPILTPGHEVIISLSLLAGRYYPGLLMHPLLARELHRAVQVPTDQGGILRYGHIWALDGLSGGFHCSVDPDKFQSSRTRMVEKADREAYVQLERHRQVVAAEKNAEQESFEQEDEDVDMLQQEERMNEGGHFDDFYMDRAEDVEMQ